MQWEFKNKHVEGTFNFASKPPTESLGVSLFQINVFGSKKKVLGEASLHCNDDKLQLLPTALNLNRLNFLFVR